MSGFEYKRGLVAALIFVSLFWILAMASEKAFLFYAFQFDSRTMMELIPGFTVLNVVLVVGVFLLSVFGSSQFYFAKGSSRYHPSGLSSGAMIGVFDVIFLYTTIIIFAGGLTWIDFLIVPGIVCVNAVFGHFLGKRD